MKDSKEYIIACAIIVNGCIYIGKSYDEAINQCRGINKINAVVWSKEGFVTNKLRFINDKIAYRLAQENGQLKREQDSSSISNFLRKLMPEDIW